jgi:c-di-GMP-binding flagellar brake protein YcgR
MTDAERRAGPRLKTLITTEVMTPSREVANEEQLPATCLDLSVAGMVFALQRALRPGSTIIATLELPGGSLNAYATVLRYERTKRAGWWKIAVKFDDLFEDDRRRIAEYVEAERDKRLY